MENREIKIVRDSEGKAFELAFIVLAILVWVYTVWVFIRLPETVPVHFGLSGAPDAYGSRGSILVLGILMTVMGAGMMWGVYYHFKVNLPGVDICNARQAALAARMTRLMGLTMLLLSAAIVFDTWRGHILMAFVVLAVLLAICAVFISLIYKAK